MRFLLLSLLIVAGTGLNPTFPPRPVYAQGIISRAQSDAIYQWADVIRKCKTAPLMWEVVGLMDEVISKVAAKRTTQNAIFLGLLRQLRTAAKLKAQGLESGNQGLLQVAEQTIQKVLQLAKQ